VLYCVECGCCSGELGKGWSAFVCEDPDGNDPPSIAVYCSPCAASEFGYRRELAEKYVCAWEHHCRAVDPKTFSGSTRRPQRDWRLVGATS
jgi:hypothetical protein